MCIGQEVALVVFFWNLPPAAWINRLKNAGSKVWLSVGTVAQAREAAAAGADALIVQGSEAGGHNKSKIGLLTLLPAVVDAVEPLPIIAAGGIATGRSVAAALALGADAVCVGTRLLASHEAYAHAEYKLRVVAATEADITTTDPPRRRQNHVLSPALEIKDQPIVCVIKKLTFFVTFDSFDFARKSKKSSGATR